MTEAEYQRYQKRLAYGWRAEQALLVPRNIPRWVDDIEKEYQCSFVLFLKRERTLGQSWAQIARSIEVKKDTLGHWVRKYKRQGLL